MSCMKSGLEGQIRVCSKRTKISITAAPVGIHQGAAVNLRVAFCSWSNWYLNDKLLLKVVPRYFILSLRSVVYSFHVW